MNGADITNQLREAVQYSRASDIDNVWSVTNQALTTLSSKSEAGLSSKQDFYIALIIDFLCQRGDHERIIKLFSTLMVHFQNPQNLEEDLHLFSIRAYAQAMEMSGMESEAKEQLNIIAESRLNGNDKDYQRLVKLAQSLRNRKPAQEQQYKRQYLRSANGEKIVKRAEPIRYRKQLERMLMKKMKRNAMTREDKHSMPSRVISPVDAACFFCNSESDIIPYLKKETAIGDANFCGQCIVSISEVRPRFSDEGLRTNDKFSFSHERACSFCDPHLDATTRWLQNPSLAICPMCSPNHNIDYPDVFCSFCGIKIYASNPRSMERRPQTMTTSIFWCPTCREQQETVGEKLRRKFGNEFIDLDKVRITADCRELLPAKWVCIHEVIPVKIDPERVSIAMVNPSNYDARNQIKEFFPKGTFRFFDFLVCEELAFERVAAALYGKNVVDEAKNERESLLNRKIYMLLYGFSGDIVYGYVEPFKIKKRIERNQLKGIAGFLVDG